MNRASSRRPRPRLLLLPLLAGLCVVCIPRPAVAQLGGPRGTVSGAASDAAQAGDPRAIAPVGSDVASTAALTGSPRAIAPVGSDAVTPAAQVGRPRAIAPVPSDVASGAALTGSPRAIAPAGSDAASTAAQDGNDDFDFEFGEWRVQLSRRLDPLTGSDEWVEYEGTSVVRPVWDGRANLGELTVEGPSGRIEGMSLRLYDPATGQWSIRWANSRDGAMGPPMIGGFADGVGEFYNQELLDGRAIFVRFIFSDLTPSSFQLEQAFSADGGRSWEPNWIARFER